MDVDFYITVAAIFICGIFMIVTVAMNVYVHKCYWPLYVIVATVFALLIWKGIRELLIVKYQDNE